MILEADLDAGLKSEKKWKSSRLNAANQSLLIYNKT